jgi:hypothetical protein
MVSDVIASEDHLADVLVETEDELLDVGRVEVGVLRSSKTDNRIFIS